jgi:hypothetical protein
MILNLKKTRKDQIMKGTQRRGKGIKRLKGNRMRKRKKEIVKKKVKHQMDSHQVLNHIMKR